MKESKTNQEVQDKKVMHNWIGNADDRTIEVTEKAGKVKGGGKRRREEKRHMKGTHTLRKKREPKKPRQRRKIKFL